MGFDPKMFETAFRDLAVRIVVLEGLVELLVQKGVISRDEWDWREKKVRREVEDRLVTTEGLPLQ